MIGRPQKYELYNKYEGLKESFLDLQSDEKTKKNYRYVLAKCSKTEEMLNKDLAEFTYSDFDILWGNLRATSEQSLQYQKSVIGQYVDYCLNKSNIGNQARTNFVDMFKPEDFRKYVNKVWEKKKIITREEVYDIMEFCENAQDAAMFIMFEGVGGLKLEELINLKKDAINSDNNSLLLTRNDGSERVLDDVAPEFIDILLEASRETEYDTIRFDRPYSYKLVDTQYVFKNIEERNNSVSLQITYGSLQQRFKKIKAMWGNEYITPTSVMISGMVDYAKRYMEKNNIEKLTTPDYIHITERFGIKGVNYHTTKTRILKHLETK